MQKAIQFQDKRTCEQKVLDHLIQYGHIDFFTALKEANTTRLPEYIRKLRRKGWDIVTIDNGQGKTCTYQLNKTEL